MFIGQFVFSQLMQHLPLTTFNRCVDRYQGQHKVKSFSCLDQFLSMAFAQLTYRESLRDIEACLGSQESKLYHLGFRCSIKRNTLSNANATRDWRIYADLAYHLIEIARKLYANEPLAAELKQTVYALDATTIDLCLSLFPWAHFRQTKAAVKMHTLLDLRGNIPTFIHITDGKCHEVNVFNHLPIEPNAFYIMDRGYLDYQKLYQLSEAHAFFVVRAKHNMAFKRRYSYPVDRSSGVICDQIGTFTGYQSQINYPATIRRIKLKDPDTQKTIVVLTNHMSLPSSSVAALYRSRWQVELFFKWIKQHLRIKAFFGTSENAVKTQIWIAISIYVLIAIVKKRLALSQSLYEILQILSVTAFDKTPLNQLFQKDSCKSKVTPPLKQASLLL